MKIFDPKDLAKKPRADMFLPLWVNLLGIFLDACALVLLAATVITGNYLLLTAVAFFAVLGILAYLCWRNQTVRMLDSSRFEYTSFLGKKTVYRFSDIKELKVNSDSLTLLVGDGKVHIESCVNISAEFIERVDAVLAEKNGETGAEE